MDAVDLTLWLETWGYIGLLVLLLATGIGSPVPEDLLLLCAGYLVSVGVLEWPLTCLVAGLGVVSSDVVVYLAGRHVAWRSERHAGTLLSPERLRRATRWFDRWGNRVVLVARLVPGTRALVFITAGMKPVPVGQFLRLDAAGAAIWIPAMLATGYFAGHRVGDLTNVIAAFERAGVLVFIAACALLAVWLTLGREESKL